MVERACCACMPIPEVKCCYFQKLGEEIFHRPKCRSKHALHAPRASSLYEGGRGAKADQISKATIINGEEGERERDSEEADSKKQRELYRKDIPILEQQENATLPKQPFNTIPRFSTPPKATPTTTKTTNDTRPNN